MVLALDLGQPSSNISSAREPAPAAIDVEDPKRQMALPCGASKRTRVPEFQQRAQRGRVHKLTMASKQPSQDELMHLVVSGWDGHEALHCGKSGGFGGMRTQAAVVT